MRWKSWFEPGPKRIKRKESPPLPIQTPSLNKELIVKPLVWQLEEPLNPDIQLLPSFANVRYKQMLLDKLAQDRHFNSILFELKEAHHADGRGLSWISQDNGHYLSLRMGDNESPHPTAQILHLKIQAYGKIIDKTGKFHSEDELTQPTQLIEDCHIALSDWLKWPLWLAPRLPVDVRKLEEDFLQKQQAKIIAEQQTGIAIESLPIHSSPSIPLVTPVHQEVSSKDQGKIVVEPQAQVLISPEEQGKVKVSITYPAESTGMQVFTWEISKEAIDKANSAGLGEAKAGKYGKGLRWQESEKCKNGIRLMPGDSSADWNSQKENYVQIRRNGKVIGPDQQEIKPTEEFPDPSSNPIAHIREKEWLEWETPLGQDK